MILKFLPALCILTLSALCAWAETPIPPWSGESWSRTGEVNIRQTASRTQPGLTRVSWVKVNHDARLNIGLEEGKALQIAGSDCPSVVTGSGFCTLEITQGEEKKWGYVSDTLHVELEAVFFLRRGISVNFGPAPKPKIRLRWAETSPHVIHDVDIPVNRGHPITLVNEDSIPFQYRFFLFKVEPKDQWSISDGTCVKEILAPGESCTMQIYLDSKINGPKTGRVMLNERLPHDSDHIPVIAPLSLAGEVLNGFSAMGRDALRVGDPCPEKNQKTEIWIKETSRTFDISRRKKFTGTIKTALCPYTFVSKRSNPQNGEIIPLEFGRCQHSVLA